MLSRSAYASYKYSLQTYTTMSKYNTEFNVSSWVHYAWPLTIHKSKHQIRIFQIGTERAIKYILNQINSTANYMLLLNQGHVIVLQFLTAHAYRYNFFYITTS